MFYKSFPLLLIFLAFGCIMNAQQEIKNTDWAQLKMYQSENALLQKNKSMDAPLVVFMGNSITESWKDLSTGFFKNPNYINRGISGQTTSQMLIRFRQDVLDLKPAIVVILAGINDIAGNTGLMTLEQTLGNIVSMVQLAQAENIEVLLCSVLPANYFPWQPEIEPADQVIALNVMLKQFAELQGLIYVDYYTLMVNDIKGLDQNISSDGVHPTPEGYALMEPLIKNRIEQALKQGNRN